MTYYYRVVGNRCAADEEAKRKFLCLFYCQTQSYCSSYHMHRTDIATLELVKHCYSILMITKPNVENL